MRTATDATNQIDVWLGWTLLVVLLALLFAVLRDLANRTYRTQRYLLALFRAWIRLTLALLWLPDFGMPVFSRRRKKQTPARAPKRVRAAPPQAPMTRRAAKFYARSRRPERSYAAARWNPAMPAPTPAPSEPLTIPPPAAAPTRARARKTAPAPAPAAANQLPPLPMKPRHSARLLPVPQGDPFAPIWRDPPPSGARPVSPLPPSPATARKRART